MGGGRGAVNKDQWKRHGQPKHPPPFKHQKPTLQVGRRVAYQGFSAILWLFVGSQQNFAFYLFSVNGLLF